MSDAAEYKQLRSSDRVSLPGDLYFKSNYRSQWWYVTGHLKGDDGNQYGFEQTFFTVRVNQKKSSSAFAIQNMYVVHSALTDINGGQFLFQDAISRGEFNSAGARSDRFDVWLGQNRMVGDIQFFQIMVDTDDYTLNLNLQSQKPPILHGVDGYSNKVSGCEVCASLYFSMTNLTVLGTLVRGEKTINVTGKAWFDREINSDADTQAVKGWDWFSIQLSDGREVMLYNIRNKQGGVDTASSGTVVYPDGRYKSLSAADFQIKPLATYTSKKTDIRYPSKWRVNVPSEKIGITVTPVVEDQEFIATYTTFNSYWEGACNVEGSISGNAYVELSGYE